MKTKHFLLLVLAFIISIPNYAQRPQRTEFGDIVITSCVDMFTRLCYGKGTLEIVSSKKPISISFENIKKIKTSDNKNAFQLSEAYAHFDEMNITISGNMLVYLDLTEMKDTLSHKIVCSSGFVSWSGEGIERYGNIIKECPVEIESGIADRLQKGYIFAATDEKKFDSDILKYLDIDPIYRNVLPVGNANKKVFGITKSGDFMGKFGLLSKDKKRTLLQKELGLEQYFMFCYGASIIYPMCIIDEKFDRHKYLVFPTGSSLRKNNLSFRGQLVFKVKETGQILNRFKTREENLKACADIWKNFDKYEMIPYNGEWENNDSVVTVVSKTKYIPKDEYYRSATAKAKNLLIGTYTGKFELGTATFRFNSNNTFTVTLSGSRTQTNKTLVGVIRDVIRFNATISGTYNVKLEKSSDYSNIGFEFMDDLGKLRTINLDYNYNSCKYNVTRTINGVREPGDYGNWLGENVVGLLGSKYLAALSGKQLFTLFPGFRSFPKLLNKTVTTTKKK